MESAALMKEPVAESPPENEKVVANVHDVARAAWFCIVLNEFTQTLSARLERFFGICNLVRSPRYTLRELYSFVNGIILGWLLRHHQQLHHHHQRHINRAYSIWECSRCPARTKSGAFYRTRRIYLLVEQVSKVYFDFVTINLPYYAAFSQCEIKLEKDLDSLLFS